MVRERANPTNQEIIVAGLDPSLTGLALCFYNGYDGLSVSTCNKKQQAKHFGVKVDEMSTVGNIERIIYLRNWVNDLLALNRPIKVFIEGYAFGKSQKSHAMGEIGGLLRVMLREQRFNFSIIPPSSLKKYVTGKGNSKKEVMLMRTFKSWGIDDEILTDDDQVDAYGLARMAFHQIMYQSGNSKWAEKEPRWRNTIIEGLVKTIADAN